MKQKFAKNDLVIYQAKSGAIELRGDFVKETIWATQAQLVDIFEIDQSVASRHIHNIFKDGEISQTSNMQKMHNANSDKPVVYYSLDVILAVGYRANSSRAIRFRQWATQVLKKHLIEGYTINRSRIAKNYSAFMKSVADVQSLLPEHFLIDPKNVLDLIKEFAGTWVSLDAYDKGTLQSSGFTKKAVQLNAEELSGAIVRLRQELMKKGEAADIFATERQEGGIENIIGNVMQSFGGEDLYGSVEEKAAHLLYFVVKNHPFIDGNKRSGAFAFVWFLRKTGIKGGTRINPSGLTALTLLTAESRPEQKEKIISLIVQLLK